MRVRKIPDGTVTPPYGDPDPVAAMLIAQLWKSLDEMGCRRLARDIRKIIAKEITRDE